MELSEFLKKFAAQLESKVNALLPARYVPKAEATDFNSCRTPYPAQREAVRALCTAYRQGDRALFLVGEPGCGKTLLTSWILHDIKAFPALIDCPSHLVDWWKEEILSAYPEMKIFTIPDVASRKKGVSDYATLQRIHESGESFDALIISRESMKTEFPVRPVCIKRRIGRKIADCCPACFQPVDEEQVETVLKRPSKCAACSAPMYTHYSAPWGRPSLARYIQRKMKNVFRHIVFDEAHELSGDNTAQGGVLGKLSSKAKILLLTGTLMGGYASSLFRLLMRAAPKDLLQEGYSHSAVDAFIKQYGVVEKVVSEREISNPKTSFSKRTQKSVTYKQRPGLSPLFVGNFLLNKAVFLRLTDFADILPVYNEHPIGCTMHPAVVEGYKQLFGASSMSAKYLRIQSQCIQAMLAWPDAHREERIISWDESSQCEKLSLYVPSVDLAIGETDKERQLVEIVRQAKSDGRKVLVFTTQTNKRDLQPTIYQLLMEHGIKTSVMRRTVSTRSRRDWIDTKSDKVDALVMHPQLVQTGLNLLDFSVIVFFDTGYKTITMRQASRRSYRLSQTWPQIDVYYLYTKDTIQQDCLSLMASKIEVSLMAEGEMSSNGLSTMSKSSDGSVLQQLAKVISGELQTESPLAVFSRLNKFINTGKEKKRVQPAKSFVVDEIVVDSQALQREFAMHTVIAKEFNLRGQALLPF